MRSTLPAWVPVVLGIGVLSLGLSDHDPAGKNHLYQIIGGSLFVGGSCLAIGKKLRRETQERKRRRLARRGFEVIQTGASTAPQRNDDHG